MNTKEAIQILSILKEYDWLGERDKEAIELAIWFLKREVEIKKILERGK